MVDVRILKSKPIRSYLKQRDTIIPRKKLVDLIDGQLFGEEVRLPPNVSERDAIDLVANSSWAKRLAEGVCGPGYAGFTPGTPEYDRCVYNVSHKVAAGILGLKW